VFDRTPDGRILQRNFGGHRYPRLAHVGDRTGLEMIRTLQDHGIHQGMTVHMEYTVVSLLKDGDRIAGAFCYEARARAVCLVSSEGRHSCHRRHRAGLQDHSNSWEGTGDGHALAYHAGAELIDMNSFSSIRPE